MQSAGLGGMMVICMVCSEAYAFSGQPLIRPVTSISRGLRANSAASRLLPQKSFQKSSSAAMHQILRAGTRQQSLGALAGRLEPEPKEHFKLKNSQIILLGLLARIQGMAIKSGIVLVFAFVAYHVVIGALKSIGFWIGSGFLGVSAFFAWRWIKDRNSSSEKSS